MTGKRSSAEEPASGSASPGDEPPPGGRAVQEPEEEPQVKTVESTRVSPAKGGVNPPPPSTEPGDSSLLPDDTPAVEIPPRPVG